MADETIETTTPVVGDGVVTIPIPTQQPEEKCMPEPIDLPPNVGAQLQLESIGNVQMTNANGRAVANMAIGVLQAAMARNFDELGAEEGKSVSGLMATPIASPATQQK